jgi:hypothetical protein
MRLIVVFMLMVFAASAFAQDVKYDSAVISYYVARHKLYISINGKEYTGDTTELHPAESTESLSPFISKIQEYENRGWLCIDIKSILTASGGRAYLAYLRRKKE